MRWQEQPYGPYGPQMNHYLWKFQAASYQPLPPISHQNIHAGTEKAQDSRCLKANLETELGRIFTKYRGQWSR